MNYELAKKLKEAGFEQEGDGVYIEEKYTCEHHCGTSGYEDCCSCDGIRLCSENPDNTIHNEAYIPTLEEIIDACGDEFRGVSRNPKGRILGIEYMAHSFISEDMVGESNSLKEAVANLWLKLNE